MASADHGSGWNAAASRALRHNHPSLSENESSSASDFDDSAQAPPSQPAASSRTTQSSNFLRKAPIPLTTIHRASVSKTNPAPAPASPRQFTGGRLSSTQPVNMSSTASFEKEKRAWERNIEQVAKKNSTTARPQQRRDRALSIPVASSPNNKRAQELAAHPFVPAARGYQPLFHPPAPPTLKKKKSELALRLGGLMNEITHHENEKQRIDFIEPEPLVGDHEDGPGTIGLTSRASKGKSSMAVTIGDWKPFDNKTYNRIQSAAPSHRDSNTNMSTVSAVVPQHARTKSQVYAEITTRQNRYAEPVAKVMATLVYQYVSIGATLLSLYLHDLDYAVMPPNADLACSIILLLLLVFFALELIVSCLVKKNYFLSFYFWLDLIGTVSLIFDIQFIVNSFWSSSASSTGTGGRISRSASVVRLTRLARILRVIRLVRIVRLFRYHNPVSMQKHPSKVGLHLSELMDKRVILMVLCMAIVLPFLTADPSWDDQSCALGLELLVDSLNLTDLNLVSASYVASHGDLFYLLVNTPALGMQTLVDRRSDSAYSGLRTEELDIYQAGNSIAMFSVRDSVYLTSAFNLATTTLIIVVFVAGSWVITRNVHALVVAPLERMTVIIRKLAGTVCFLSTNTEEGERELQDGLETQVIENIIEKMASIFAVQPDANAALPKPLQMMAGSKHTEILTNSSVVSIEVIERPKENTSTVIVDDGTVSDDRSTWFELDAAGQHKEFASIDAILNHPSLIPYFHAYLDSCFVAENLMFCQEVDRFRSIAKLHALNLYNSFISGRAHNQINIESAEKQAIFDRLSDPTTVMFDHAQRECLELMRGHWRFFLQSKYCRRYLRKKAEQEKKKAKFRNFKAPKPSMAKHVVGSDTHSEDASLLPSSQQATHRDSDTVSQMASHRSMEAVNGEETHRVSTVDEIVAINHQQNDVDTGRARTLSTVSSEAPDGGLAKRAEAVKSDEQHTHFPGSVND